MTHPSPPREAVITLHDRGLEAAIGFHICANLVKFVAAYLVSAGIWFT